MVFIRIVIYDGLLGAFPTLREAIIGLSTTICMSVCLSVHTEQLGSNWTDFHEILFVKMFGKLLRRFELPYNLERITGTLNGG